MVNFNDTEWTDYPTVRRYPRSLAEAWPKEHAVPIIRPYHPRIDWWAGVALAIAIGAALACLLVAWV